MGLSELHPPFSCNRHTTHQRSHSPAEFHTAQVPDLMRPPGLRRVSHSRVPREVAPHTNSKECHFASKRLLFLGSGSPTCCLLSIWVQFGAQLPPLTGSRWRQAPQRRRRRRSAASCSGCHSNLHRSSPFPLPGPLQFLDTAPSGPLQ